MDTDTLLVRQLGIMDYETVWKAMSAFTDRRTQETQDELWLVQHPSVFTLGQAGKLVHVLNPGDIPVIKTDRGGQVTYHGLGQQVGYPLVDLRRRKLGVRQLVELIEQALLDVLQRWGIDACLQQGAPGLYVDGQKIASLGLRVRRGCSFHGFSLNVDMDLEPFVRINPCGYEGLRMTQMADIVENKTAVFEKKVAQQKKVDFMNLERYIIEQFVKRLGYVQWCYQASSDLSDLYDITG